MGLDLNLERLFEVQKKLDDHIIQKKGLKGQDLLAKKILALLVELGELANEWRGFKFWSNDQEPRTRHLEPDIEHFDKTRETRWIESNPLLEEYVDCLHFLLSIGLESDIGTFSRDELAPSKMDSIEIQFISLFEAASRFIYDINYYPEMWELFLGLGEMLGFTWQQVEEAYFQKNAVNHERQENGY